MAEMNDFNAQVIEEFRTNHGKVGGNFDGAPWSSLRQQVPSPGKKRTNPLVSQPSGDVIYIFASKAGAPTNPDWYYNLLAHPEVEAEIGDGTSSAPCASTVEGPERDRIYAKQVEVFPGFGDYEKATDRVIPVVELRRISVVSRTSRADPFAFIGGALLPGLGPRFWNTRLGHGVFAAVEPRGAREFSVTLSSAGTSRPPPDRSPVSDRREVEWDARDSPGRSERRGLLPG